MTETRDRILDAARSLLAEHPDARPSVRAVAARAGIGASTLRHHFPTQRALLDALLSEVLVAAYPDGRIQDASMDPAARLTDCVAGLLVPVGHGEQARTAMRQLAGAMLDADSTDSTSPAMERLIAAARDRVVSWLTVLEREGSVSAGDHERRARLLLTVVDGLALNRALPGGRLDEREERAVIEDAVAAVLAPDPPR